MSFSKAIKILTIQAKNLEHNTATRGYPIPTDQEASDYREVVAAINFLEVGNLGGLSHLVSLIRQWGIERGITGENAKATVQTQFDKLLEEVEEINVGIKTNDLSEMIDGIGDTTVVLILLSELLGISFETCLLTAYEEIKNRKGKMINGQFVKETPDSDLDEPLGERTCQEGEVCETCQ
jgi:NTP pyrophosphatase (non-canonical NTP hydrolase)